MRGGQALGLRCSVAVIIIATLLPFGGMPDENIPPAWCLKCGALWLTDAIANVALFVPFGAALSSFRRPAWQVTLSALLFSILVEVLQSVGVPPGRSAALADILTNTTGGALGALGVAVLRSEDTRSPRAASWLATGWTALSLCVLMLTTFALQPLDVRVTRSATQARTSPFGYVPGFGWFAGVTDSASFDGRMLRHDSQGPMIIETSTTPVSVSATVWAHGGDRRTSRVPLLFVHQHGDSSAWLHIAKLGEDAELSVKRTASRWGLVIPTPVVPDAFRQRAIGESSPVTLTAVVTSAALVLRHEARADTVRFTPLLGWALIQPVIGVQHTLAGVAAWCWIWFWLFPIGWWSWRSARPRVLFAAFAATTITALQALPTVLGVAALHAVEWAMVLCSLAGGAIVANASRGRRQPVT